MPKVNKIVFLYGAVAQLGERLNTMQLKVMGPSRDPLGARSTRRRNPHNSEFKIEVHTAKEIKLVNKSEGAKTGVYEYNPSITYFTYISPII